MNEKPPKEADKRARGFAADILPGLTTAAVVVPKALAYATIAALPVQAGLFAALVPMAVYAALGTSPLLSVSTTTPIAILCAVAIGEALQANPGLDPLTASATLSVLVGALLIAARVLRHVLGGRRNTRIAAGLGTAEKTVKIQRGRVMRKMQAASLAHLLSMAGQAGVHPE